MLSFFPRDVLDEILNLIESVSEGFCYLHLVLLKYPMSSIKFQVHQSIGSRKKMFKEDV